ncbi:MAG: lysophospholipid acyltransferase family protein, partial [Polyangiaceae bacterium]
SGRFESLPLALEDACILQAALDRGRGVLFVSAHLGPWEQVAASVVAAGFPVTTIARQSYDPRLTAIYDTLRGKHGVRSIYRGAAGASVRAMRHLRSGRMLGVVMDLKSRVQSISAPFFDHDAPTAVGPARLALRTGAQVVVASAASAENKALRITVTSIDSSDLRPGADGEHELTGRINAEISRRVRALPDRWVWMHPRF